MKIDIEVDMLLVWTTNKIGSKLKNGMVDSKLIEE
jgi:hypothetical protein